MERTLAKVTNLTSDDESQREAAVILAAKQGDKVAY